MATDFNGDRQRLPIKLIMPKQGAERRVEAADDRRRPVTGSDRLDQDGAMDLYARDTSDASPSTMGSFSERADTI